MAFLAGYLLEKSLSIDNLFIFALIFNHYMIPTRVRAKTLLFGIIVALLLRGTMIVLGSALLNEFHWVIYIFAGFLIYSGFTMFFSHDEDKKLSSLPSRALAKIIPLTNEFKGTQLFVRRQGKLWATPVFVAMMVIAFMDLLFAVDSIPAVFAVTREPFLVFAANLFALLGLRSLYFLLEGMMVKFLYLESALSFIMVFIGLKMLLSETAWAISTPVSLLFIVSIIGFAVIISFFKQKR